MRRSLLLLLALSACLATLSACQAFTYGAWDLRGKSLTYSMDLINGASPNGHDTAVFVFNGTGKTGAFTCSGYAYGFATRAAFDAGEYTGKSWYQNDGVSGTFAYSAEARYLCMTITSVYAVRDGATALDGAEDLYAAEDYAWQDLDTHLSALYGSAVTGASWVSSLTVELNADALYMTYRATTAAYTWMYATERVLTFSMNGAAHSHVKTDTRTLIVKEGSIREDRTVISSDDLKVSEPKTTEEIVSVNTIDHAFLVGKEDDTDETFSSIWRKGSSVTFQVERTRYQYTCYTGDTAPGSVAVDESTGTGSSSGTGWYCYADMNVQPGTYDLTHEGTSVIFTAQTLSAARSMAIR